MSLQNVTLFYVLLSLYQIERFPVCIRQSINLFTIFVLTRLYIRNVNLILDIMKIKNVLMSVSAVAVMASCTGKVSDVTEIKGTVVPEGIDEVEVVVGTVVDTLVPVTDGKFSITVPADPSVMAVISAADYGVSFISDGTPLEIVLDEKPVVKSKYPGISIQERFNKFNADEEAFRERFDAERMKIMSDTLLTDDQKQEAFMEYYESFAVEYRNHNIQEVQANSDNFVALLALQNLVGECDDEQMSSLLNGLSPALQEHKFVQVVKGVIEARMSTAPGQMFKDFTVNTVVGQTRSIPPQPKYAEVKLSDYVGKGKYILLDFWAPWCGPCKKEMPNIKKIYEKYAGKDFDVVSIAVWERQPVDVTISTAAELGMNWNLINNAGGEPAALYGVEAIPHLILFGPDGTILKRGFYGLEGMEEAISEYL